MALSDNSFVQICTNFELETEDNEIVTVIAKDEGPKNTRIPIDMAITSTGNLIPHLHIQIL